MLKLGLIVLVMLTQACGDSSSSPDDATAPGDVPTCSPDCVESRWWLSTSSNCMVLCSANPSYPECSQRDCAVGDARRFDGTSVKTLSPLMYSDNARSFQLLGGVMTNTYVIDTSCMLRVGNQPPMDFTCTADELRFSTGNLRAASSAQTVALDAALAAGAPGRYQY